MPWWNVAYFRHTKTVQACDPANRTLCVNQLLQNEERHGNYGIQILEKDSIKLCLVTGNDKDVSMIVRGVDCALGRDMEWEAGLMVFNREQGGWNQMSRSRRQNGGHKTDAGSVL